jgi:protein subunit release factor A
VEVLPLTTMDEVDVKISPADLKIDVFRFAGGDVRRHDGSAADAHPSEDRGDMPE